MSGPGVLPIVECGDPVLRRPAEPVDPSDLRTSELRLLIAQMRATMEAAPGVGLAASQVGVPVQLVVLHDGPERLGQLTEDERMARERYDLPFTVLANPALQPGGEGEQRCRSRTSRAPSSNSSTRARSATSAWARRARRRSAGPTPMRTWNSPAPRAVAGYIERSVQEIAKRSDEQH